MGDPKQQTSHNALNHAQAHNATTNPLSDTFCKAPTQPHRIFTTTPDVVTSNVDEVDSADPDAADTNVQDIDSADPDAADAKFENIDSADPDAADADIENADAADSEADYEADSDADYEVDNYDDADDNETRLTNKLNVCEAFDSIFDGPDPNPDGRSEAETAGSLADETRPPGRHQKPTATTSMTEMTASK